MEIFKAQVEGSKNFVLSAKLKPFITRQLARADRSLAWVVAYSKNYLMASTSANCIENLSKEADGAKWPTHEEAHEASSLA